MPKKKKEAPMRKHRGPYTPYTHTETKIVGPGAKQSMKDECDINNIVARYEKTGVMTHLNASQATYTDVSELSGYQDALEKVERAREVFMALPSELRAQFENNPALYLDFMATATPEQIEDLGGKVYGNKSGQISPDKAPKEGAETQPEGDLAE